jgi:hypothetical protein
MLPNSNAGDLILTWLPVRLFQLIVLDYVYFEVVLMSNYL